MIDRKSKNILIAIRHQTLRSCDLNYTFQRAVLNDYARQWVAMYPDVIKIMLWGARGEA